MAVNHPEQVRRVAVVSMAHPRRLRAAHLTDMAQLRASRAVLGFQRPILPERRLTADDADEVSRLLHRWAGGDWPDEEADRRYRLAAQIPGVAHSALESYRWAVRSVPRPDGLRYARRMRIPVRVPTLHLHGELDPTVLTRSAQGSGRYVEAPYRWRTIPKAGHFPHEEQPEVFTDELLGWLRDPEPDR
jgi:pimeloyl-ACP methyl ester carboxylesterase